MFFFSLFFPFFRIISGRGRWYVFLCRCSDSYMLLIFHNSLPCEFKLSKPSFLKMFTFPFSKTVYIFVNCYISYIFIRLFIYYDFFHIFYIFYVVGHFMFSFFFRFFPDFFYIWFFSKKVLTFWKNPMLITWLTVFRVECLNQETILC